MCFPSINIFETFLYIYPAVTFILKLSMFNNVTPDIPAGIASPNLSYNPWYDLMLSTTIGRSGVGFLFFGWVYFSILLVGAEVELKIYSIFVLYFYLPTLSIQFLGLVPPHLSSSL